jgi:predicted Zn-dependent protease
VEYSSKINYDASKMADFFLVLKEMQLNSEQGGVPTFLSTHPDPGDRYNTVHNEAKQWQDSLKYNDWQVNRETYLNRIDGIVYGDDPRQGFVESNSFYHPAFKFQFPYPKGWKLINTPLQVQIAPEDGKAIIILSLSEKNNLDQAADANIEALNLQVSERKSLNVKGLPAISIDSKQIPEGTQSNPQDTIRLNSYFIQYDQKIYVFHGITFDSIYDKYRDDFTGTMANFSRLTDPGKLNKQPQRIRIKQVQRSGTVKDVLGYYGVPEAQKQNIAFLNNMDLTDKLERGDLLKIVSD